jgi:fructoselysine-6-P-deglycase FrlB-like protein
VQAHPPLSATSLRHGCKPHRKNITAVPTTDLVTNPMDYFSPRIRCCWSFARSGNSPESVAAVELANQFVPECYHLSITCNEAAACTRTPSTAITPLPC